MKTRKPRPAVEARRRVRPQVELLEDRVVPSVSLIEGFENGNLSNYRSILHYLPAAGVSPAGAHDGNPGLGLVKNDGYEWLFRNDAAAQVQRGQTVSAWVKLADAADGRAYVGFGAIPQNTTTQASTSSRTYALVLAPNTNQLLFQFVTSGTHTTITPAGVVSQTYQANHWYRVEIAWGATGSMTGRLYDSDGVTLLNTVNASDTTAGRPTAGGISFRGFGSPKHFDTVVLDTDSTATPQDLAAVGGGLPPGHQPGTPPAPLANLPINPNDISLPFAYASLPGTGRDIQHNAIGAAPTVFGSGLIDGAPWVAVAAPNTSLNVGTQGVDWGPEFGGPATPLIRQWLLRQRPGQPTQVIGLPADGKHFFAPSILPPGSPDTYSAGLNATQGLMTPGSEIDPVTGRLHRPSAARSQNVDGVNNITVPRSPTPLDYRLRAPVADLDPAQNPEGTRWFYMAMIYVEGDQNIDNNSRWVEIRPAVSGTTVSFTRVGSEQLNFRGIPGLTPGPIVSGQTPSGTVSGPVSSVRIQFDRPINPSTFTLADVVSFTGPAGPITPTAVTPVSGSESQFDITFPAQSADGVYTVVLGPDILDTSGDAMNQNQNTILGEVPDDRYTGTFRIGAPLGTISGLKFNDLNGNGVLDAGEPGLPGWTIFLDQNNNGSRDISAISFASSNVPVDLPDVSTATSNLVVPTYMTGTVADVNITFNITHTFVGDLRISLISPQGTSVVIVDRVGGGSANFTNTTLDDQAGTPIASGTAPFTGSFRPSNLLSAFNGQLVAGTWRLQIEDLAGSDSGTLLSWSLTFTTDEPAVTTDSSGAYLFTNLAPGSYNVREVQQSGWVQTAPAGGVHAVTLTAAEGARNVLFGNRQPTTNLVINTVTTNRSGFVVTFSGPIDPSVLNLYDGPAGALGAADLTLTDSLGEAVRGSLVVSSDGTRITFIKTGGPLDPGSYTLTLRSAADGFRTTAGGLLDGNGDGTAGDPYTGTLVVSPAGGVVVGIPDVVRGPEQAVNVPADGAGLPLTLSDGSGVTSVTLSLRYNPALLTITGATAVPAGASVTLDTSTPGVAVISFTSPTPLGAGAVTFVRLTASVPAGAPYKTKQILDLDGISINGGAIAAIDDDGLHLAAYLGDTTGNGNYSAVDATRALQAATGQGSGFAALPLTDPLLVADVTGNGTLNATDATRILQKVVGQEVAQIPDLPANPPVEVGSIDPLLNIPKRFRGRPGSLITVPVRLDFSEGLQNGELAISFDNLRLEVVSVTRGSLTRDFDLFATNLDNEAGSLQAVFHRSAGPVTGRGAGTVLRITFRVRSDAPAGGAIINLRQNLGSTTTQLNEGAFDLIPDPSNEAGDSLDGLIRVLAGRRVAPVKELIGGQADTFRLGGLDLVSLVGRKKRSG